MTRVTVFERAERRSDIRCSGAWRSMEDRVAKRTISFGAFASLVGLAVSAQSAERLVGTDWVTAMSGFRPARSVRGLVARQLDGRIEVLR